MPIDTSIYSNLLSRPKSYQDFQNEDIATQGNALSLQLGRQKADEYTRGVQEQNAMRDVVRGFGGDQQANYTNILAKTGNYKAGQEYLKGESDLAKSRADVGKVAADTNKAKVETAHKVLDYAIQGLQTIGDPTNAAAYINQGVAKGYWDMQGAQSMLGEMQRAPSYEAWRANQLKQVTAAKDQMPKIETRNLGGRTDTLAIDPFTGKASVSNSAINTQSPDSIASNATSRSNALLADNRARETAAATLSKPFEVTGPEGTPILVQQDKKGNIKRVDGFSPKPGTGGKLTEDQGKATGWLVQAENAWKNMQAVGLDKTGGITDAAKPGFADTVAAVPSFGAGGAIANSFRTVDRQKFMQSSSALSEALLRAATGAGVNKEEAAQKIREITPVFGDDDETIKQKFASVPLYLESLKVRAGPGAKQAAGIVPTGGGLPSEFSDADLDAAIARKLKATPRGAN